MPDLVFVIPDRPEELQKPSCTSLHVSNFVSDVNEEFAVCACQEAAALIDGASNSTIVVDQEALDSLYASIRSFDLLPQHSRDGLVIRVCKLATLLASDANEVFQAGASTNDDNVQDLASSSSAIAFFLKWLCIQCCKTHEKEEQASASTATGRKPKGRKTKKDADSEWDHLKCLERVAKACAVLVGCDLDYLFDAATKCTRLMDTVMETMRVILLDPAAWKREDVRTAAMKVVGQAAARQDQAASLGEALMSIAHEAEHGPDVVLTMVKHVEATNSAAGLALAILEEFLSKPPQWYDDQEKAALAIVKASSEVLSGLAEVAPKVVARNLVKIQPFLGCTAAPVRVAVVRAIKTVLVLLYNDKAEGEERSQQGRITSKDSCLKILFQRILDKAAHVRVAVLKCMAEVVVAGAMPLVLLPELYHAVTSRLTDGVSVQKEALKTVQIILERNPWGDCLVKADLEATLVQLEKQLQALPAGDDDDDDGSSGGHEVWQGGDALAAGHDQHRKQQQQKQGRTKNKASTSTGDNGDVDDDDDDDNEDVDEDVVSDEDSMMDVDGLTPVKKNKKQSRTNKSGRTQQAEGEAENEGTSGHPAVTGKMEPETQEITEALLQPTQQDNAGASIHGDRVKLRTLIATLKVGIHFAEAIQSNLVLVKEALITSSADVVKEAITVIAFMAKLRIPGSDSVLRAMWSCIFSREEAVRGTVVDAVYNLYLKDMPGCGPDEHAAALSQLMHNGRFGELTAFEEILKHLCGDMHSGSSAADIDVDDDGPALNTRVVKALLRHVERAYENASLAVKDVDQQAWTIHLRQLRAGLTILGLIAPYKSKILLPKTMNLLALARACMSDKIQDAWSVRQVCLILKSMSSTIHEASVTLQAGLAQEVITGMVRVLTTDKLGGDWWYTAAEAALSCLYSLHPEPHLIMQPLLSGMMRSALPSGQLNAVPASVLSRAVFLVSHTTILHLALIDRTAKRVRQESVLTERLAAEAKDKAAEAAAAAKGKRGAGKSGTAGAVPVDDLSATVGGAAAVSLDAAVDVMKDTVDAQVLAKDSFLHQLSLFISYLTMPEVHAQMPSHSTLRGSLLLALSKLMAVDKDYCDRHMRRYMDWLNNTTLDGEARSSLVIAAADLTTRWPNVVEPETYHMYQPLHSLDKGVRKTALTVISHLILADMMKVKGHISSVALRLLDDEPEIANWAHRFFTTLATRSSGGKGGTNPLYNLLPDIQSALTKVPGLSLDDQKAVMKVLLSYVKDSKQCDSFKEKLCHRFAKLHEHNAATADQFEGSEGQSQAAAEEACNTQNTAAINKGAADDHRANDHQDAAADGHDTVAIKQEAMMLTDQERAGNTGPVMATQPGNTMDMDADMDVDDAPQPGQGGATQQTSTSTQKPGVENASSQDGHAGHTSQQQQQQQQACVVKEWRLLAYCLQELGYSEKSARMMMEGLKHYKHTLGDKEVFGVFWNLAQHAKKRGDAKTDIRDVATKYMAEIKEVHLALCQSRTTAADDLADDEQDPQDAAGAAQDAEQATKDQDHTHQDGNEKEDSVQGSQAGNAGGRATRRGTTTSSSGTAGGKKNAAKAGRAGNTRRRGARAADSDQDDEDVDVAALDDIEEEEEDSDSDEDGSVANNKGGNARVAGRAASKKKPSSQATRGVGRARKPRAVNSDDDDDVDNASDDQDSDGMSDAQGHSVGSEVHNKMQKLKVTASSSTGGASRSRATAAKAGKAGTTATSAAALQGSSGAHAEGGRRSSGRSTRMLRVKEEPGYGDDE